MSQAEPTQSGRAGHTRKNLPKQLWHLITRQDITSLLIVVLCVFAIVGSCFPQWLADSEVRNLQYETWKEGVRGRYGSLTDLLFALGTSRIFHSPVFLGIIAFLALSTLACTLDRWKAVWRRAFHQEVICPEAIFDVTPLSERFSISKEADLPSAAADLLRERGYRVRTHMGGDRIHLRADRNRYSPAATLVTHLGILLLLLGVLLSTLFSWREELVITENVPVSLQHRPEITIDFSQFHIERYPDGNVSNYVANIQLVIPEQDAINATLRVNEPLRYKGFYVLLQGYQRTTDKTTLSLLTTLDPGYGFVIAAGFTLLFGITVSFFLPHCCIHIRITPEEEIRLAGRADRKACDFAREFTAIADELRDVKLKQEERREQVA